MSNPFQNIFNAQQANQFQVAKANYKQRIAKLEALKQAIEVDYKQAIRDALYADFKKPFIETDLTEIYPIVSEIKYVKSNLKGWMAKQKVKTPMALLGTRSWFMYEPKGVCLIISPWNFPLNLTFGPLVSAIAAGNTVILKPSELTPNIAKVMAKIIETLFSKDEIALIQGDVAVSEALLKLPFNHIFFTGSPQVGKIVMQAASRHLTSVTLELGGKSPTVIDESANLKEAARRIAWGKFLNNGQICVSPDYVLIHEGVKTEFITELKSVIQDFYGEEAMRSSAYCRIVNDKHVNRLKHYIQDAKTLGATIECGGDFNADERFFAPTIVSKLPDEALLLQDEIFGPILPIKSYGKIEEAIDYINSKSKPLALYVYSKNKKQIQQIISATRAGSTCINSNILQYSNHNLPFGGSNTSGIGKSHGIFGFQEFSNERSVLKQYANGTISLLFPPYNSFKQKLIDFTIKWF